MHIENKTRLRGWIVSAYNISKAVNSANVSVLRIVSGPPLNSLVHEQNNRVVSSPRASVWCVTYSSVRFPAMPSLRTRSATIAMVAPLPRDAALFRLQKSRYLSDCSLSVSHAHSSSTDRFSPGQAHMERPMKHRKTRSGVRREAILLYERGGAGSGAY